MIDLDELERLYKEATPGEWYLAGCNTVHGSDHQEIAHPYNMGGDAELIVALHNAFPALLALARDGERYRWLRDRRAYVAIAPHSDHVPRNQRTGWTTRLITGNDENMDAAIDAARKGEKP